MKPFLRNAFFVVIIAFALVGCNANERFKLTSSTVGTFATATATVHEKNGHYTIDIRITTQGMYNLVKGKRIEHYRSTGRVRHGLYISQRLMIERYTRTLHSINEYLLDHKRKKIVRHYREWHGKKLTKESTVTMDHYGTNDYLTLFHNIQKSNIKKHKSGSTYVVAASEETHGKVHTYYSRDPRELRRWGGDPKGTLLQMGIHKGIFEKGRGSFTLLLDRNNRMIKFIMSPVKLGGTVTGLPLRK